MLMTNASGKCQLSVATVFVAESASAVFRLSLPTVTTWLLLRRLPTFGKERGYTLRQ